MIKPSKMRWVDRPPKRVARRKAGGVCRVAKNTGGGGEFGRIFMWVLLLEGLGFSDNEV